jgi:GxxExxY protein
MCGRRFRFRGCCIDSIRSQTDSPPSTPRAPRNAELDCDGLLEYVIRWREFTAEYAGRREMREKGQLDQITRQIIGAAIEVHKAVGPGLLESAYQACLAYEVLQRGLKAEEQVPLPVLYKDVRLDCGYRMDLLVEDSVIVEIKAVERLCPIHDAQLLSYLRIAHKQVGLLINFHNRVLKDGVKRIVNEFPDSAISAVNGL